MTESIESNKYHTDAIYRCRIINEKKNFYVSRLAAILKNNGDKKSLYIPRNEIYIQKTLIDNKLGNGDYVSLKIQLNGRRANVTEVLSYDITIKVNKTDKKLKSEESNKEIKKEKKVQNIFSVLYDSSSDSEQE